MSRIHEALKKAEQERAERSPIAVPSIMTETASTAEAPVSTPLPAMPSVPEGAPFEKLKKQCAKPEWKPDPRVIVFTDDHQSPLAAEQFRTLRSRLYRLREKYPCSKVLVTSALPQEGKTFVATNFAEAIVQQSDRRALLIDADLRSPRLHLGLGAPFSPGLSEYLQGEVDETAIIQCAPEGNLFFVPAGKVPSNPAELLAGARLKGFIDRMTPLFDWIVVDSPPALPVADASLLAGLCDGVLLVVRSGDTPYDAAKKASSEFREKNLIGVVLNRAEETGSYSSYYYHGVYGKD